MTFFTGFIISLVALGSGLIIGALASVLSGQAHAGFTSAIGTVIIYGLIGAVIGTIGLLIAAAIVALTGNTSGAAGLAVLPGIVAVIASAFIAYMWLGNSS